MKFDLKDEKTRRLVLIGAVAFIALVFLLQSKKGTAAGSAEQSSDASGIGLGGGGFDGGYGTTTGSTGVSLDGISSQLSDLAAAINGGVVNASSGKKYNLNYELDNSYDVTATGSYSKSSGGGGWSIGGGGFSLGSKNNTNTTSKQASFSETSKDIFTNASSAEGINEQELGKLLDFFKDIGGTYQQRRDSQLTGQQQAADNSNRLIGSGVVTGKIATTTNTTVNGQTVKDTNVVTL